MEYIDFSPCLLITKDFIEQDETLKKKVDDDENIKALSEILKQIEENAKTPKPNIEIRIKNLQKLKYGLLDLLKTKIKDYDLLSQEKKDHLIKCLDENEHSK